MTVQNYESNTPAQILLSKIERPPLPTTTLRKTSFALRRSSVKSTEESSGIKAPLDQVGPQITTTIPAIDEQPVVDNTKEQVLAPITNKITETKQDFNDQLIAQQSRLELADNRKRVKKGAFDASESMTDLVAFELGMMGGGSRGAMKRNQFRLGKENHKTLNEDGTEAIPENQLTLDLLEKIRQSSSGLSVGQPPVSQQVCF